MVLLGIILFIIGLTMIIKPSFIWLIAESWKSEDATEPSGLYLMSTRFGGIMCSLVGISSIVITFL
ncbi:DUF6199 family natural product biosynthesis protein [Litchfieldia alkalitelluris]|uniref:DUF6199 family natural product biosynthesis protein n=1 Tax=Litchfieldia alkalitelluris TaxID=304268 RepID=UPI0009977DAB|nr:DUF6199 family natural product biosynthesis protein [Litchfieldia alkalitelluris]